MKGTYSAALKLVHFLQNVCAFLAGEVEAAGRGQERSAQRLCEVPQCIFLVHFAVSAKSGRPCDAASRMSELVRALHRGIVQLKQRE